MIDVTFTINQVDISGKLSTYDVSYDFEYPNIVTTLDGTEHFGAIRKRPIITFSLRPLTAAENAALYSAISTASTLVTYTDPHANTDYTAYMRFDGSAEAKFALSSVDGNKYYKGGSLTLRQLSPR